MQAANQSKKQKIIRVVLTSLGIVFLCLAGLYLYEVFPHFIQPSISPPYDDYGSPIWLFPTYSVTSQGTFRYFTWKEITTLSYEKIPEEKSRQQIISYISKQLLKQGWARSDFDPKLYNDCEDDNIFPEALIPYTIQDYSPYDLLTYRRQNFASLLNGKETDEICLFIWRHWQHVSGIFNVVLFSIKPSPRTWLLSTPMFAYHGPSR
ncbi:MAG: hypothetical protein M1282_02445 [Chloroflexi bacterium]|nr:hypothetical protein [Chloroflexota bacterium]